LTRKPESGKGMRKIELDCPCATKINAPILS
jgi:hypothetical protein